MGKQRTTDMGSEINTHGDLVLELVSVLEDAEGHLDYCGYGDTWERDCALRPEDGTLPLDDRIKAVLDKARECDLFVAFERTQTRNGKMARMLLRLAKDSKVGASMRDRHGRYAIPGREKQDREPDPAFTQTIIRNMAVTGLSGKEKPGPEFPGTPWWDSKNATEAAGKRAVLVSVLERIAEVVITDMDSVAEVRRIAQAALDTLGAVA